MVQCLLQNRISFAGLGGCIYTYIKIKGKGIHITEVDRKEAQNIIREQNLIYAEPNEYNSYDSSLGVIYTDGKFKTYVNNHQKIKNNLLFLLDKLDNE